MAYRVGIAGATGLVGQRLISRLAGHPWFRVERLGASERSAGRRYRDAARWLLPEPIPEAAAERVVTGCAPSDFAGCDVVISALDATTGRTVEPALAASGLAVVSNSSAMRLDPDVPLLVPEINAAHTDRLSRPEGSRGFVVTNPNCSVTGLAIALAPLHRAFGVRRVVVTTLQAVSGAGLEGPRAIELLDNVLPYIAGEEEKIEVELAKILGSAGERGFTPAAIDVAAHCHRVNTLDGHLEAVSVELARRPSVDEAIDVLEAFEGDVAGLALPTAPQRLLVVRREPDRPQPRLDRDTGGGMTVVVGRVRPCPVLTLRLVVLSHNTVRGAAGGAILNAELLAVRGLLPGAFRVIVMKFGGTSVADAERILAAAEIVRGRLERRPAVVVSALAGVTDLLVRAVTCARTGDREGQEPILADVARRHRWAAAAVTSSRPRHDLDLAIDAKVEDLRGLLRSVRVLGEGTPRAVDAILATGEILSSEIVAAAFVERGLPARLLDARDVVVTDESHGGASPDLDATAARAAERIAPVAATGQVPVLGGYIGRSRAGHTTTLGRGGSDTSAAVLGAVLSAEEIEIWTDVDGILSADPRRVATARPRERVSFAEAAELACYGAKVLHPASIAPAVVRGIPVRVLNAMRPNGAGTLVLEDAGTGAPPLASIASRGGVATVRVVAPTMRLDAALLDRVLDAFASAALPIELVVASEVGVSVAVTATPALDAVLSRLSDLGSVTLASARGIVCVVGKGLAENGPARGLVLGALARHAPEIVALGGSSVSLAAVVPEGALDACVRDLHREFFEEAG